MMETLYTRPERAVPTPVRGHGSASTLAADVRKRLGPPGGTRWANGSSRGVESEGGEPAAIGCGMGHVPRKSRRFLYFFTKREP
jgi:hypothetical protein